jgi:predicted TIM-barrel fold metal-dependent hydrolase
MDRDQIDVAVIYPTDELPLTVTLDAGFATARARSYNDWLHDYCEVCPQRLKGIGLVALQDVDGAIEEMHRATSRLNMVGIQIGCTVREDTLLSDARLSPFWAEAERLNVPIAVHGPALPSLFRSYFDVNRPDHMLEASHMAHTFAQMLACSNIITSGILERFSKLKIAFLEAGAGWVPTGCTAWTSTTRSRPPGGRTSRPSRASTSRAVACSSAASPATSSSRSSSTMSARTR